MYSQKCEICGKKGFADLRSHLRAHKVTWQEYQERFDIKVNPYKLIAPRRPESIIEIEQYERDRALKYKYRG